MSAEDPAPATMDLREYLRIIRRKRLLVGLVTALGLALGIASTLLMPPKYEASTQLYVSVRSQAGSTGDLVQGSSFAREVVGSYVDVVGTGVVLDPVIAELDLDTSVSELRKRVEASTPGESVLIDISVTDTDPEQAARIAGAVGRSLAEAVQSRLEPERTDGQSSVTLTTTQEALTEEGPISPRPELLVPAGFLLGLLCGIGVAVLSVVLDKRVRSVRDVNQVTEKPVIGRIPRDPAVAEDPLVVRTHPRSATAEAFRTLRTNLDFLAVGSGSRTFVISSSSVGEGKSVTAANISLTLAKAGLRVVLVDCDLRRPRIAEYFGIEGGAGLTDVLAGRAEPSDVLQPWGEDGLRVLAAGRIPPNPSELLGSETMDAVIETLSDDYDYVILDAPPTLAVTDAAVVGTKAAGVLLVAAAGSTEKHALDDAIRTHEGVGTSVAGIVVTMLPPTGEDVYGYGRDAYGEPPTAEDELGEDEIREGRARDCAASAEQDPGVPVDDERPGRDDPVGENPATVELPLVEAAWAESKTRPGGTS
ncbi:capsular exopolysaccharide synthesis family protein [Brevibacterium sanguinis]|uniref:Capsular exopolysaccharide synthesis family protein n=2 Tax=Brevibacterium TaxID=1696 RepID=A0A366ILB0_9MICO|nr:MULTISPECIES: polysaccharide biosynthesis tyrosine autokinase [Brevibacterium]RBP66971.1 capsular exopolysaccharide synthesis family protein [Brevibacterium sanguinis]RBP73496.1 capsular exopolysaccharide synthesis family protein [Brevibacterium celere]